MALWKKILIGISLFILAIGIGFGGASFYYGSTTADLRIRVKQITSERNDAVQAELAAKEAVSGLASRLDKAEGRVDSLTQGIRGLTTEVSKLTETNRRFADGISRIEGGLEIISSGVRGVTDSVTESGGLIQESVGILFGISKRSGKTDK